MKSMIGGACAALFGLAITAAPQAATAAVVGEYNACGSENLSIPVTALGHTWVPVATVDAVSLQNLDALVLRVCSSYNGNAAVDAAVANGMNLVLDASYIAGGSVLPGAPAFAFNTGGGCEDTAIPAGSPVATGPGGMLTNASLDNGGPVPYCSIMNSTSVATLPAGIMPFVTTAEGGRAAALGYTHGAGTVAVSVSQWSHVPVYTPSQDVYAGIKTYFLNALSWGMNFIPPPTTTCASEGYTGTQLTWCRNICEMGYTSSTLNTWIRRWTDRYRTLPYCAVAPQ